MNKFKKDQIVFVFDPNRQSIYQCKIKDIIKDKDGEDFIFILTPSNSHLPPEVKLSKNNIFKTFKEAFEYSLE